MESRIKNIMAETFNIPKESITDECSIDSIEHWDSLSHTNLIMALEQNFGISFKTDEIIDMLNFKLIKLIIEEKLN
ncbi:MAG: acyl carrier protein [Bacteriovoracaceae bacterium]|nr:acyl carrier protein [Bacteriovoracaceae bacterium]